MIQVNVEDYKDYVHLHVCNGGATFSIEQTENGAEFKIKTHSFENCKVKINKKL